MTSVTTPGSVNRANLPAVGLASVESSKSSLDPTLPGSRFSGTNAISVNFLNPGNAPMRIVLNYTQSDIPRYKPGVDGTTPTWEPDGITQGAAAQKTFGDPAGPEEFALQRADGGVTLAWEDGGQETGGIKSVQQVQVYLQNANGEWVLHQTINGGTVLTPIDIYDLSPTDIGRNVQSLTYNAFGEVTSRAMNDSVYEFAEYDNSGHVWRTNAGDGVTRVMYYDIRGNVTQQLTSIIRPGNALNDLKPYATAEDVHGAMSTDYLEISGVDVAETRYDLMGRAVMRKDPERVDGTLAGDVLRTPTTHMKYDRWGNVIEVTDPRNVDWRITYSYNALNQQTERSTVTVTNGVNATVSSEVSYFDQIGRALGGRDANRNLTTISYGQNEATTVRFADGTTDVSVLDVFGQRTSLKSRDGLTTTYAYDLMGNMKSSSRITSQVYYTVDQQDGGGMGR